MIKRTLSKILSTPHLPHEDEVVFEGVEMGQHCRGTVSLGKDLCYLGAEQDRDLYRRHIAVQA